MMIAIRTQSHFATMRTGKLCCESESIRGRYFDVVPSKNHLLSTMDLLQRSITISGAGSVIVNGVYTARTPEVVPAAFVMVCRKARWTPKQMWDQLNQNRVWWEASNGSYLYFNSDGKWWLDSGETGLGLYINTPVEDSLLPPIVGWSAMGEGVLPLPLLQFSKPNFIN